jgi:hypothetical protein
MNNIKFECRSCQFTDKSEAVMITHRRYCHTHLPVMDYRKYVRKGLTIGGAI